MSKKTLTYEYVCNYIKENGCEMISEKYIRTTDNIDIKLFRIPYYKFNKINQEISKILEQVNPVPSLIKKEG